MTGKGTTSYSRALRHPAPSPLWRLGTALTRDAPRAQPLHHQVDPPPFSQRRPPDLLPPLLRRPPPRRAARPRAAAVQHVCALARASGEATLRDNYARLVEGAEKGWRAEEGDFERVLIELVGFEKRDLLGETGKIGALLASPALLLSPRVCPTIG